MTESELAERVTELFRERGDSLYGGEAVTQLEHALQAADLAEQAGSAGPLILAALFHDIGHLLHNLPDDAPDDGIDDFHERLGDRWLRKYFTPAVATPVRQHVAAKRYLCAADPEYLAALSPPSLQSLALQGGPFTADEAQEFEQQPFFQDSIELRRWDDQAKVPGLPTPPLEHFLSYLPAGMLPSFALES
jgi:phosphonate degradation associated HDIG domain protein